MFCPHLLWALEGGRAGPCAPKAVPLGLVAEGSDWPPRAACLWRALINSGGLLQPPPHRRAVRMAFRLAHRGAVTAAAPRQLTSPGGAGGSVGPQPADALTAEADGESQATANLSPELSSRLSTFSWGLRPLRQSYPPRIGSASPMQLLPRAGRRAACEGPHVRGAGTCCVLCRAWSVFGMCLSLRSAPGVARQCWRGVQGPVCVPHVVELCCFCSRGSGWGNGLRGGPPTRASSVHRQLTALAFGHVLTACPGRSCLLWEKCGVSLPSLV